MKLSVVRYSMIFIIWLTICSCNNEEKVKAHIRANQQLLIKKQTELNDLNYKVTHNSLRIGTNDYDSTIGRDFNSRSNAIQASIDSLKAETDSLEQMPGM